MSGSSASSCEADEPGQPPIGLFYRTTFSVVGFSGVEVRHGGEGVRLERGASHESAVNIRLSHELLDVAGLGASAVKDARGVGGRIAVVGAQGLANGVADLLRVICGGGLAGADGPDRLVGDDDLGDVFRAPALQSGADLVETNVTWVPALRISRASPQHRIGVMPASSTLRALAPTSSSDSPWYSRRSE